MTKTISLTLAAIVIAIITFAGIAFAAIPVSPEGHWALNEGSGTNANDSSVNNNDGTISGGAVYTSSGIAPTPGNTFALTFDGVDDFVTIPNSAALDMTAAYSLSAWVNVTDIATYRPILFRGATNADDIEVYVQSGSGDLIVAHNRGNGGTFDFVGFSPPPVGTLFHLVVTYDGTNVQAYYNGVAAAVVQQTIAVGAPLATGKPWMMGKVDHTAFGGTFFFSGLLDEVLIYDRVLTAAEIAALMTSSTILVVDDDGVVGFDESCDGTEAIAYTTIQAAVNAASAGNTVKVCPGTYTETVSVTKTLTLKGAKFGVDARTRSTSDESIVNGPGGSFALGANGIVVDGFTVQDQTTDPQGTGIKTSPLFSGYQIRNNIIKNNVFGIYLHSEGTTQTLVSQNLFQTNNNPGASAGNGIYSDQGAVNILIDNNKFTGDLGTSVNFPYSIAGPAVASDITISNNEMTAEGAIFALKVTTLDISDNTISNPLNHGMQLEGNSGVTITGNTITGVSDVVNFGWSAIRLSTASGVGANSGVTITGNTLSGGVYALGINISNGAMTGTLEVHNNAIVGHETGVNNGDSDIGEMVDAECNWWGSASGPGPVGPGSGDTVSSNVDFTPWLTTSTLTGPCDGPLANVTVTIHKYVDSVHANVTNAESESFPMQSSWNATNIGAGLGSFSLAPTTYDAQTSSMSSGADYSTNEVLTGPSVGASCTEGKPFALVGYSTGDTEALAASSSATTTSPAFTNITTDKHVIVWNTDCVTSHIIIVKDAIPNDAQDFSFTNDFGNGNPSPFLLDDDADGTLSNTRDSIVLPGTYVVNETPAAGWLATDLVCVDPSGGTIVNVAAGQANIDVVAGETVTCTYTNEKETDLVAVKTNNTSNAALVGVPFNWVITVTNIALGASTFFNGERILTDDLPTSGATYGTPVPVNGGGTTGTVSCSIVSNTLDCTASGTVVIPASGTITVTIPVTPTAAGSLVNPRVAGSCLVDPDGVVTELIGGNNFCGNTVDVTSPPDVTVTIVKYVGLVHATAGNANSSAFPMSATWNATNIGAGSGTFTLSPVGFNNPNPYEATTADMSSGASYATNEDTTTPVVGASCTAGKQFRLAGYSTGDSLALAQAAAVSTTSPAFTNITSDKFVIVWNEPCPGTLIVQKVIVNDNGGTATSTAFSFKVDGGASQLFEADGQNDVSVAAGSHSVVEDANSGYTTTYTNSANGNLDCNALAVPNGGSVTCTITNNDKPASLTLQKVVVNNDGGTATPANWTLTATGPTGFGGFGPSVTNAGISAGTYDLSENGPLLYSASNWVCVGGNQTDGDTVVIGVGETITCTITNNDNPGVLIVKKVLINDNGGSSSVTSFKFKVNGGTAQAFQSDAQNDINSLPGSYSVVENAAVGYLTSYVNSANANADCNALTVAQGQTVTCTITNNDVPPPPPNACSLSSVPGYTLVNGTSGTDVVTLAPFTMFVGNGGNDVVTSNKNGNYIVCTLGGNDVIKLSGSGAATIDAGNGNNTVVTGNGNKVVTTGSGNDVISTGSGNDTIHAGAGNNKVFSKAGNDGLTALGGNDFFDAGAGVDTCSPGGGVNTVLNCTP